MRLYPYPVLHHEKEQPFCQGLLVVQVTGFEPTRLSTLEPETSASAVPPHPHFLVFRPLFLHGKDTRGGHNANPHSRKFYTVAGRGGATFS